RTHQCALQSLVRRHPERQAHFRAVLVPVARTRRTHPDQVPLSLLSGTRSWIFAASCNRFS
ncbi:hypothetical protein LPJ73_007516, partial [Coemansia sp. RSA 2703]